ncbi:MAG: hypothetical protein AVDCRST_MAG76-488 [uncultured Acidimicrobiales bacterium]|uniref:Integral membrane protein n=1 Tax=uncultured Acidimicrobiales bacterium TaxID=310071 RepID=A0A6J4HB25_9ACTN|nr:MAG: hypothetical protein AVDCRST_MAG76-488 [uncultured Acidimicrobiales bacterium]
MPLTRNQALLLRAFSGWTIYVWVTRMWNIWRDDARDVPFKAVHSMLALVSIALALAALVVVQRNRRSAPSAPERDQVDA